MNDAAPRVPLFATQAVIEPLLPEIARRQRAVLESGRYVLGPELAAFEAEFAAHLGRRHCVGVGNGTDALTIALRALGIDPGDEVVVPAYTFIATAEAVVNAGARPAFADVDPRTQCMSAATAEPVIGARTRAIIPVDIFGNPAPAGELAELAVSSGLPLIADAAQAAGAELDGRPAGAFGDAATFSFYPAKNLGAFGDAGALVTDDERIATRARRLRDHGASGRWRHEESGFNSRLDELQATALRVLLPHLDSWIERRREVASWYRDAGIEQLVELPATVPGARHAYHLYVALADDRDSLIARLAESGVEARAYYTPSLDRQPAMIRYSQGKAFPHAAAVAARNLALPMGPALSQGDVERVVAALRVAAGTSDRGLS